MIVVVVVVVVVIGWDEGVGRSSSVGVVAVVDEERSHEPTKGNASITSN
jgi:hypothetical protein